MKSVLRVLALFVWLAVQVPLLASLLALFAAVASAQEDAQQPFRCPDGALVTVEMKGRPYQCPDDNAQRAADASWKSLKDEAEGHKRETEEWVANYRKGNDQVMGAFQQAYEAKVNAKASAGALLSLIDSAMEDNTRLAALNRQNADMTIRAEYSKRKAQYFSPGVAGGLREGYGEEAPREAKERRDRIGVIDKAEADNSSTLRPLRDAALRVLARDCRDIFKSTIDKKTADLTVRETQQITGCRSLNFYQE
jgi:hypothetical protein